MPKMTEGRLEARKKKLLEKFSPEFEIKSWREKLIDYIPDFKKIWDEKTTLYQKTKFVKEAHLDHIVKINPDTKQFPEWAMLETNYQQTLREAIRRVIE